MKKVGKIILTTIVITVLFGAIYLNLGMYYHPAPLYGNTDTINGDVLKELRFLKHSIEKGGANDMQALFPEGFVFINALYGLTWCEVASDLNKEGELYQEAREEIRKAYKRIDSDEGRIIFNEQLPLPYGAFYNGWCNYLLGKKLSVEKPQARDSHDIDAFKKRCEQIALAIRGHGTLYLTSYSHGAWPADMVLCIASLSLHDRLFDPVYQNAISQWILDVKSNLDSNGLIPHAVHPVSGKIIETARGSSQSLMLNFLPDIDPGFAAQQFSIYKNLFLDYRFGLPGIREYPKGSDGAGDVDSGPVILQMGASATIVGLRTMTLFKEASVSIALRNSIEAFGLPIRKADTKKYLFGKLPMADAFIAWAHTAEDIQETGPSISYSWRIQFHLYSLVLIIPCVLLLLFIWGFRFRKI